MSKKYYENRTEAITAAKQFLTKAQEDAEWIYMQRQMEPNIRMLINKFYYSMFYCISAILALKTNEQFKIHDSAINAFNFYIYNNDGCGASSKAANDGKIAIPESSSEFEGENYKDVVTRLE